MDSSESSGESVSGFSSSGYSFQSVIAGEHEVHSLEVSDTGLGKACPHKIEDHQQNKDKPSKPQNQKRDQPLKVSFCLKKTNYILYVLESIFIVHGNYSVFFHSQCRFKGIVTWENQLKFE